MTEINFFPTNLALGASFCNRTQETIRLTHDIKNLNPTLIISPRRYGKTSLAINTFKKLNLPYTHIDFYKELSEEDIERAILNGIGKLLGQLTTSPQKLLKIASEFFMEMKINVGLDSSGIKLELNKTTKRASDTIFDALEKLHAALKKRNKHGILYMDEFQVLGEIAKNHTIEAAIREAAQKSSHLSYVFSGSNRHLMQQMFYDKKRPFYQLCDIIVLERITEDDYKKFIQVAALKKWGKELSQEVLSQIFLLTERHPHYINKLCSLIWLNKYPTLETTCNLWQQYVLENKSLIERELSLLSINQRKILVYLSKNQIDKLKMPASSFAQSIHVLLEKDYIYVDKTGDYQVLDPLIKNILQL